MYGSFRYLFLAMLLVMQASRALAECNDAIPLTRPDSRYVDNHDGTVIDTVTGLMWRQCPEGMSSRETACDSGTEKPFTWQQAMQWASEVNQGDTGNNLGYSDWRLPELLELKSLAEMACFNPAINTHLFPHTPALYFWSATPVVSKEEMAWGVGFYYGGDRWGTRNDHRYVRLVRKAR